jgi:thiol-disulfide isomerase/thioredoxin
MNEQQAPKEQKKGINVYLLVFGVIAAIIILAALSTLVFNKSLTGSSVTLASLHNYGPAPNIQGISYWINSQPLNITQLRGKVVLVDFWTYSCINCIRSIPQLNAWESEYGNNGLVIIGVHTPEFQFEHNYTNVLNAVEKFGIKYPVAMDNNYDTWDAYNNQYWPADYLIDKNGDIRYVNFGEGNYNETEQAIRVLLENASYVVPQNLTSVPSTTNFSQIGTPEIYFGYAEARQPLGNQEGFSPGNIIDYKLVNATQVNTAYLAGSWFNAPDSMIAVNGSKIFLVYKAKDVNIVASGNESNITIKIDGVDLNQGDAGSDVKIINGTDVATINSSRLYNIVAEPTYGIHVLEIDANPGFRIYTFTFG